MYSSTTFLVMREKSTIPSLSWRIRGSSRGPNTKWKLCGVGSGAHCSGGGRNACIFSVQYEICMVLFVIRVLVVRMPIADRQPYFIGPEHVRW